MLTVIIISILAYTLHYASEYKRIFPWKSISMPEIYEHLKTKVIHFVFFKIYILFNYNFNAWAWISDESIVEEYLQ